MSNSAINTFCNCERHHSHWNCVCGQLMVEINSGVLNCYRCGRKKEIREHHASNCPKSMKQKKKRTKKAKKEKLQNVQ